ncbi:Crp/Fnr family transcriptional regulator [Paenibacillus beijingensis]|uniref:Crp/Fnr family transcriptional regulator n=1 Tax=Paenibacillus beijingensis TaxID=1126833 RepID=A0A0D5NJ71_9BACL|nr:Crp/Fnr family transcriptional regulator [Paenibacillus beijingensis]AJY75130.1 Crp/Fnr family transcriptional regulator [Paenibacillus beijingensis]
MLSLQTAAAPSAANGQGFNRNPVYELFRNYGTLREFPKNTFIFTKGTPPFAGYFIEKGIIKICQVTTEGRDVTFFVRKTGDAFGLAEIILQQNHPCYAQCLQDSQIWVLNASVIREKIAADPDVNREIMVMLTSRLLHHQSTLELLVSKPAPWRLAWLLQQLSVPSADGKRIVDMVLNHEEISNMIGCSRQTVSELLSKWKSKGIVTYNRKHMVLQNLESMIEEI